MADSKVSDLTGIDPALEDYFYIIDVSDTTDGPAGSSKKGILNRILGVNNQIVQGRLTLTSGTPATIDDVLGASTLYFSPYKGNVVALYDGTRWILYKFSEISLALSSLTTAKNYDVFLYYNSSLTLELVAWNTNTARATNIVLQDGAYVKSGETTKRYIGTLRTTSTTTTEDSAKKRFLWNYYNRRPKLVFVYDLTDSWTYTTATYRQKRGNGDNQVEIVNGLREDAISLTASTISSNSSTVSRMNAIGYDSTTGRATTGSLSGFTTYTGGFVGSCNAFLYQFPDIGYHLYAELEYSLASGTCTWYGDNGGVRDLSGMVGIWYC